MTRGKFFFVAIVIVLAAPIAQAGKREFDKELATYFSAVSPKASASWFSFGSKNKPAVAVATRVEQAKLALALHAKAIEHLSDADAALFIANGKETPAGSVPSLPNLAKRINSEDLYSVLSLASKKG